MTSASKPIDTAATQNFIARWSGTTASELATAQSFVMDLCALLGVAKPHATPEQDYMFERPITFSHGSTSAGRTDCYRKRVLAPETGNAGLTLTGIYNRAGSLARRPCAHGQKENPARPGPELFLPD